MKPPKSVTVVKRGENYVVGGTEAMTLVSTSSSRTIQSSPNKGRLSAQEVSSLVKRMKVAVWQMGPPRELPVFVNCPFDDKYFQIFHVILFAIHDPGYQALHALVDNSAAPRARRISEELEGCLYSVHELGLVARARGRGFHDSKCHLRLE